MWIHYQVQKKNTPSSWKVVEKLHLWKIIFGKMSSNKTRRGKRLYKTQQLFFFERIKNRNAEKIPPQNRFMYVFLSGPFKLWETRGVFLSMKDEINPTWSDCFVGIGLILISGYTVGRNNSIPCFFELFVYFLTVAGFLVSIHSAMGKSHQLDFF